MIRKPRFSPAFHVEVVESDGVYLLSERGHFVLAGRLHCRLASLLDGQHTADEIVDVLAGEASPAEVYYALARLEQRGYLADADGAGPPAPAAFWEALGVEPRGAERRLRASTVALAPFGAVPTDQLTAALNALEIRVGDDGDLVVALTDDYLQAGLAELNAASLASGRPWLLVKPVGTQLWLGPLFRPGRTGCWECLAERLRANRPVETYLQQRQQVATAFPVARAALPASVAVALHLAATETARALADPERSPLAGSVLTLDVLTLETQRHRLVRRPRCPTCGDSTAPADRVSAPLTLAPRPKPLLAAGQHRTVSPEQIVAAYEHHVSPITGVTPSLYRVPTDDDRLQHVYLAGPPLGPDRSGRDVLQPIPRTMGSGKGATDVQARASALCEALECYSATFQGDEPRRRASYRELGEQAIHPDACQSFSTVQYRERQERNAGQPCLRQIPEPFDDEAVIDWCPVWSLTERAFKYLPTGYCYFGYPSPPGQRYFRADTNGHASGNTLEEAILHALLELIERDSVAIWWYNRVPRPAVDLDRFGEPYVQAVRQQYRARQRELWVLDLTGDLGIPVFAAVTRRTDRPEEHVLLGFGAHLDPRVALLRAVTELNQLLPFVWPAPPSGGATGCGELADGGADSRRAWQAVTVATHGYLLPDVRAPARTPLDYGRLWSDDVRDDVRLCQGRIEAQGIEVLVLDQTRPDIGLPVVQAIAPGLCHFRPPRLAPGRLYDVPVKLGWLPAPLTEDELNPEPLYL